MTHAAKTLNDELAYLRSMHAMATDQGKTIIANSVASDIADLVRALEVLDKLDDERCCNCATAVAA